MLKRRDLNSPVNTRFYTRALPAFSVHPTTIKNENWKFTVQALLWAYL